MTLFAFLKTINAGEFKLVGYSKWIKAKGLLVHPDVTLSEIQDITFLKAVRIGRLVIQL